MPFGGFPQNKKMKFSISFILLILSIAFTLWLPYNNYNSSIITQIFYGFKSMKTIFEKVKLKIYQEKLIRHLDKYLVLYLSYFAKKMVSKKKSIKKSFVACEGLSEVPSGFEPL